MGHSIKILRDMWTKEGRTRGLFRGLSPNLIGNSSTWAIYWGFYESIKKFQREQRGGEGEESHVNTTSDYLLASSTAGTRFKHFKISHLTHLL
jgi:solute carrier family 25 folate transporter 32